MTEWLYLSTIDPAAGDTARQYGLGVEIASFCTAWNLDEHLPETRKALEPTLAGISRRVLHGPFNELFPCAIDPKARALAAERYRQSIRLAKGYGAAKVIIHGGYHPRIYYPVWYAEQSILFWRDFLKEDPGVQIVLENVLEETPEMLLEIVTGVDDPRLRLCLDVGHVNAYSRVPVRSWLECWAPWISHFHIHNNDGGWDSHSALSEGTIPMKELLTQAIAQCPDASFTLEVPDAAPSVRWMGENIWNLQ